MTENDTIYCCKLTDVSEVPELVTEFLSAFEYQFSSWANHAENIAYHTLYFDTESAADKAAALLFHAVAYVNAETRSKRHHLISLQADESREAQQCQEPLPN